MNHKLKMTLGLMGLVFSLFFTASVSAQTTVVVTDSTPHGWVDQSTDGGNTDFVTDADAPLGVGALELTTNDTTSAKANYSLLLEEPMAFEDITDLSYSNKTISASFDQGAASYQLSVCLGGTEGGTTCNGFTTLVYEPYWNVATEGPVIFGTWQDWDVDEGLFWSTRAYNDGSCVVTAGGGGPAIYTIDGLTATCPDAEVYQIAINVGSNNPEYVTRVDQVQFNDTIYDFEPYVVPTDMAQCKGMGWRHVRMPDGSMFRNQGQCVSYVVRTYPPGERTGKQ